MKRVLVLGATGSIGSSALDIIRNEKDKFVLCGISANSSSKAELLSKEFNCPLSFTSKEGIDGIKRLIDEGKPDIIVNGIAGSAGLKPSLIAIENKIDLALANKETIVMAGPIVLNAAKKAGSKIIPVDSEHSAIFTLIEKCGKENVEKIIITASGGPFRTWPKEKIQTATLKDALKHPTWDMGVKITVDSATLANKGLEVIEAGYLFDAYTDIENKIDVVVHPQSIVHSLVRTKDGVVYGQLSEPDMKHPIIQALEYPKVNFNYMKPFDLASSLEEGRTLTFEKPRYNDFPMLSLAFECAKKGLPYTIAFNAAGEIATGQFIKEKITLGQISKIVSETLEKDWMRKVETFDDIFALDSEVRRVAESFL